MPVGDHGSFEVRSTPTDPSTIRFPGGYCDPDSIQNTVSMDDPDDVVPATPQAITDESVSWTTTRTPARDTASATMEGRLDLELPHVNITRTDSFMSSITADNPQSFRSENTQRFELEYPDDLVTIEASNQFSREFVQLRTVVMWNGKELFDETWREPLGGESFD